jgi:hypothetical protein
MICVVLFGMSLSLLSSLQYFSVVPKESPTHNILIQYRILVFVGLLKLNRSIVSINAIVDHRSA